MLQLCAPSRQLLGHTQRHGIHEMGAAGFNVLVQCFLARADNLGQVLDGRHQLPCQRQFSADMNGCGDDIVAALAAVNVVVGVHRCA